MLRLSTGSWFANLAKIYSSDAERRNPNAA